ncbi:hypothetical protein [Bradyrhizobium sp. CB2312]|uniref:hypothetical protein n=1 Tax=Bradyrhizobium sp. CB2312 TaxID=3039155 RepID=UPI0024B1C3BA|nr:hypothetical protein [Bradyrhizobium sp. CB2312]WFU74181.1 hypothetical protein QA642_09075 [Bradyrhizobium sp. CB2312]
MARNTKAERKLAEALEFRASAKALLHDRYNDWNDWEFEWLTDEVRRSPDYVYTEKEWAVLKRLQHYSLSFADYAGYSVPEMSAIAYVSRFDFQEHEQEFAEKVHRWGATHLKRRQIRFLASLCRRFENIGYDPLPDHELLEEPEAVEKAPLSSAA